MKPGQKPVVRRTATVGDQELKRVSQADRRRIALSSTLNRFWRKQGDNRALSRQGPGRCRHCGAEPCGASWGPVKGAESALCCHACNHGDVPKWRPTHVLWHERKAFFVREVLIGRTGAVYQRQDGVVWFMRIAEDHFFLGVKLGAAEFARFKVSDPHGWPPGVRAEDLDVTASEDAGPDDEEDDDDDGEDFDGSEDENDVEGTDLEEEDDSEDEDEDEDDDSEGDEDDEGDGEEESDGDEDSADEEDDAGDDGDDGGDDDDDDDDDADDGYEDDTAATEGGPARDETK